jgi:hypothetical protein
VTAEVTTNLGKWCFQLMTLALVFFGVALVAVSFFHQTGGNKLTDNLGLGIPMLCAGICVVLSSFIGVLAIWKGHDRSPRTIASTVIGLSVVLLVLGEFLAPH